MSNKIKYPIGIQTFSEIIEEGYLYVDKTALVYDLVNSNKYVFLSRPRRFGKSLLLSTIEAYFEGRRDLFKGLAVDGLETEWKHHPVLRASLAGTSYESPEKLLDMLSSILEKWEKIYGKATESESIGPRFSAVIESAYKLTGQKVVVLIDEYDKPLLERLHNDEAFELFRDQLRGFYSAIKDCDQYIRFAMLTGVTKFGHLSVFSGLNNLNDISFESKYGSICGISETEFRTKFKDSVRQFALAKKMSETEVWKEFKENYDGYCFGQGCEGIYNPFSVLLAFQKSKLGSYWFGTGTPNFLIQLLKRYNFPLWNLEQQKQTEDELQDMTISRSNLIPLFYQSGYLTIKGFDNDSEKFILGFPNREVSKGFWNVLYKEYIQPPVDDSSSYDIDKFVDEIRQGQPEDFMQRLQALVASVSPGNSANREVHFQNVLQVIFKMLGFRVQCEVVSSSGRADMIVQTDSYVYIFEFKVDSTAEEALRQIGDKGYARPFAADSRRIFLIGASFSAKTGTLDDYIIA